MERADPRDGSRAHAGARASGTHFSSRPRTALILYGSETGNAQDVAEEVGRMAERLRFNTTVLEMDSVQLRDILKPTVILFAVSTTGQGEMPQNARKLWKALLSAALKPGVLRNVRFTSFGLGDSSYARYNVAHRMLCGRLAQLGAKLICERGEGNEQHPEGHSAGLREWIVALRQQLSDAFPMPDGLEPIAETVFIEPKWKLATSFEGVANGDRNEDGAPINRTAPSGVPSLDLLPVKGALTAHIAANERLTAADHFQDVRLMDLSVDGDVCYGPGAVAVVYPKNFPEDVDEFVTLMKWHAIADDPIRLVPTPTDGSVEHEEPSPLRQFDLSNTNLTLRWLLENTLDIMSIPRRSFFASLVYFAKETSEDEKYQKERLLELANPELIDELWDYTTRPKRTILEVMMDFTTIQIPWQYALSILPLMKGRQFSIASGGDLRQHEPGHTRVQLLVAIADPPSPIIKWRRRYGVCTRYITTLQAGQHISIGLQPGYLDVQPSEIQEPVVLIGPGTGLAPMRAMLYQRLTWAKESTTRISAEHLKDDILIFGCRNEHGDFFFHDEWEQLRREAGLTVLTAFSRDPDKPKQYVQDQIRLHGTRIYEALVDKRGKVYVCGSSGNMPKGVREALLDVLEKHGEGGFAGRADAEEYLDAMEKEGRYKQETW